MEQEITLQDKVDVAWDFLLTMNPRPRAPKVSPKQTADIKRYTADLKQKGRSQKSIEKAVLKKFNVKLTYETTR